MTVSKPLLPPLQDGAVLVVMLAARAATNVAVTLQFAVTAAVVNGPGPVVVLRPQPLMLSNTKPLFGVAVQLAVEPELTGLGVQESVPAPPGLTLVVMAYVAAERVQLSASSAT